MSDPLQAKPDLDAVVELLAAEARAYLSTVDDRPVREPGADAALKAFEGDLPSEGDGSLAPLRTLFEHGVEAATHSTGPRFYHFVIGGVTPAALGADWFTSLIDQNAGLWNASALGAHLETIATKWLLDLFDLPADWGGGLTKSATLANFAGLACARAWWADKHGVDVNEDGLTGLPPVPVFSSGYIHASAKKAIAMLGIGRGSVRTFARDATDALDLEGLERALAALDGAPVILVGNAGEVNAGDFDPLDAMADLAERYNAWLHVDGAFGIFARVTPQAAHLAAGLERADSVIGDGHKWLNVPYDCGFVFVKDPAWLPKTFVLPGAAYLPDPADPKPNYAMLLPDSSRRARAFAVWATLRAYGREGHRAMVERHLALAQSLAKHIDAAPDLERLAEVPLNIVCFRFRPDGVDPGRLDDLNRALGEEIIRDGRVFVGTTTYKGMVALRPVIVNWRTEEEHIAELVDVIRELGNALLPR